LRRVVLRRLLLLVRCIAVGLLLLRRLISRRWHSCASLTRSTRILVRLYARELPPLLLLSGRLLPGACLLLRAHLLPQRAAELDLRPLLLGQTVQRLLRLSDLRVQVRAEATVRGAQQSRLRHGLTRTVQRSRSGLAATVAFVALRRTLLRGIALCRWRLLLLLVRLLLLLQPRLLPRELLLPLAVAHRILGAAHRGARRAIVRPTLRRCALGHLLVEHCAHLLALAPSGFPRAEGPILELGQLAPAPRVARHVRGG